MAEFEVLKGLGADFTINPEGRAFDTLYDDLINRGIAPIDPDSLHITLVNSRETTIPIYSARDQAAIDSARTEVGKYLSAHAATRLSFTPDYKKLRFFGAYHSSIRRMGIRVVEQNVLMDLRSDVADIFYEEARIRLANLGKYAGHMVLGAKTDEFRRKNPQYAPFGSNRQKLPQQLAVNGFSITEKFEKKTRQEAAGGKANDNRYKNQPRSIRGR